MKNKFSQSNNVSLGDHKKAKSICEHCAKPGHTADKCYSNPKSKSFRGASKPGAKTGKPGPTRKHPWAKEPLTKCGNHATEDCTADKTCTNCHNVGIQQTGRMDADGDESKETFA